MSKQSNIKSCQKSVLSDIRKPIKNCFGKNEWPAWPLLKMSEKFFYEKQKLLMVLDSGYKR